MEEAEQWQERLRWDYRGSIELLLQYLDSRMLPGFVALLQGKVVGYTFCVIESNKAVVGDVYVSRALNLEFGLADLLMLHLLELLRASPDLDRIESQLLLYHSGELAEPFRLAGFTTYPRLYQICELNNLSNARRPVPGVLELCPWTPGIYQGVAELIHAAYARHLDALVNDQYRTLHGSLRFLHNIVRFPGCGEFDAEGSWVLRDRQTRELAAVVLCSRIGADVAHITQLCVAPRWRGRGLGAALLGHVMESLPARGYRAITLTVSEGNLPAVRLYERSGFRTLHRFDAMVLDQAPARF